MTNNDVLVLAVVLGLIPAFIAQRKGHSFLLWWFFGAAMFIVALPWVLLMKPDPRKFRQCPHCQSTISAEATACPRCTRDVRPTWSSQPLPPPPAPR